MADSTQMFCVIDYAVLLLSSSPAPRLSGALAVMAAVALGGCNLSPTAGSSAPPASLATAQVPANADLSGVRGIDVRIAATSDAGRIDLLRPDGKVVFVGRVQPGRTLVARVVIPTKDTTLTAVLHSPGSADKPLSLTIDGTAAQGTFE
jgi:hypothetical protein